MRYQLENSDKFLMNVHGENDCAGDSCPIHHKTDHHMRSFEQWYRSDRGFMERICFHGCDGCCQK